MMNTGNSLVELIGNRRKTMEERTIAAASSTLDDHQ